jgi:hypothetical protein
MLLLAMALLMFCSTRLRSWGVDVGHAVGFACPKLRWNIKSAMQAYAEGAAHGAEVASLVMGCAHFCRAGAC